MDKAREPTRTKDSFPKHQALPNALRYYWIALWILTPFGFIATMVFTKVFHLYRYPYSSTLLPPQYNNVDFNCFQERFSHFHQATFFGSLGQPFNYPAPVAMIYELFFGFMSHPATRFVEISSFCYIAASVLFAAAMVRRGIRPVIAVAFSLSVLLLSYPFMLEFLLSNMEFAVWFFLALGMWAYAKDKSWLSAVLFGLAASLKIYPIIYLGLALARRQYKQAVLGIGVCAASFLISLWLLGPSVGQAYHGLEDGVTQFKLRYIFIFNPLESGIDHSLFGIVKFGLGLTKHLRWLPSLAGTYLLVAAITGICLYFWKIRHLPPFNQVLALTIACVLLPPVSHDYTLIHLYGPFAMLVLWLLEKRTRKIEPWTVSMLITFVLLFAPENYLVVRDFRLAGAFKAVILVFLFFLALRSPIWSSGLFRMHADE